MTLLKTLLGSPSQTFLTACSTLLASMCAYRIYLHPLSHIPGPRLAAITMFYEAFYNLFWHDGQYIFHVKQLHRIYGPIIRISPNTVSINDPSFYHKVHYPGSQFEKDPSTYDAFGFGNSIFTTRSNALHAQRRAPIKDFFSRKNILGLESSIKEMAETLCGRIEKQDREEVFDLQNGLRATAIDSAAKFSFDFPFGVLASQDMGRASAKDGERRLKGFWVARYFPVVLWVPVVLGRVFVPGIELWRDVKKLAYGSLSKIKDSQEPLGKDISILHHLLNPENTKVVGVLSDEDIVQNGATCFAAGTETAFSTLNMTAFGIVSNPQVQENLYNELLEAFPDLTEGVSLVILEKLPYLTAVVKEGLRLAPGSIGYIPRVTPAGGIKYGDYFLPQGTVVATSPYFIHYGEETFPDPEKFDPERWLGPDSKALEKYLVPFGKGQRMCVGTSLAYCELYVILGTLFRRYKMEVYNTSWEDMKPGRDYFSGYPAESARDFTVKVQQRPA